MFPHERQGPVNIFISIPWLQGPVSIWRCLTSIGIPSIKIRRSHDRLIFIMEIPISRKTVFILIQGPGPWFNIKMSSYQYRTSNCGDNTMLRPSYLHNGISYTGKMLSLYWIGPLVTGQCKEPGHQQPCYWSGPPRIFCLSTKRINLRVVGRWLTLLICHHFITVSI